MDNNSTQNKNFEDHVQVYSQINEAINSKDLDIGDYMNLVAKTMESAASVTNANGKEKKELVQKVIERIVKEQDNKIIKDILTPTTVSNLVEVIIAASKGKYKLKKTWKKYKCC